MATIATVGYLNAAPLTAHIDRDLYQVIQGHPAEIAALLSSGQVDVALVPVAAVLSDPDLRVLGGVCIGAEGPVESVVWVAETPPEQWTTLFLDGASATSVVLSHLLLDGPFSGIVSPDLIRETVPATQAMARARGTTAALVIGDAAREIPARLTTRIDLSEQWTKWTSLPFVFAVWAGREGVDRTALASLRVAAELGLSERVSRYSTADATYLTERLRYELDERALVGLRRFAALAHQAGWVQHPHIQFYGPQTNRRVRTQQAERLLAQLAGGTSLSVEQMIVVGEQIPAVELAQLAHECHMSTQVEVVGVDWTLPVQVRVDTHPDEVSALVSQWREFGGQNIVIAPNERCEWSLQDWAEKMSQWTALGARVWALSLAGLDRLARQSGCPLDSVVQTLREAGLQGLARGAVISMRDDGASGLGEWSRQRGLGLGSGAMIVLGFGEEVAERVRLLYTLRSLEGLDWIRIVPAELDEDGVDPMSATAQDTLQMTALSRLILPHVPDQRATWIAGARVIAQQSLLSGCNGLGAVVMPLGSTLSDWGATRAHVKRDLHDVGLTLADDTPLR
jgi:predicted solute-binding protein